MNDLTQKNETPKWFKAILLLGILLFAFYASTHMVAAGDTWVAMACGRHFANHGVDTVEPFSFNSHKAGPSDEQLEKFPEWSRGIIRKWHPTGWVNQNWLTHLGFYKLATWFGEGDNYNFNTLVYWKFVIYFITVLLVYAVGKVLGAGNTLAAAAACLAMVVGRTYYDIRPAGYSNMLTPAFILILALAMYRNYRLIWLAVPLIVFWANVHGGYIYAFIMFVPFIGINVLLRLPRRWALCLGFIGLWAVLYLMSHKFITHEYYLAAQKALPGYTPEDISLLNNKMFGVWVFLAVISLALTVLKKLPSGLFNAYHFGAGAIYFLSLFVRFLPRRPENLNPHFDNIYSYFISSSLLSFIFVFVVGGLLICAMAFKKERFISLSARGVYHTIGASAVALLAMVIFNPFHFTNLTHTFEISISEHAESWRQVNEWKPAFDFMDKTTTTPNPVGEQEWFGAMCILTLVVFFIWLITYFLKPRIDKIITKQPEPDNHFTWPKINLALIVISFLTIYMAIRSRRFIAIAGLAACPIVALFIVQTWQMICAILRYKESNHLETGSIPPIIQNITKGTITLAILSLAVFWGMKYKRIYLDPWPSDPQYNSVFMRMTASHLKPMEVGQFIKMNKISGRVFNYWTEGGAVALGQKPDAKTGRIPLKLFMDGRAQAAYNHDKFRLWQTIFSGGPIVQQARAQKKKISQKDLKGIGQWIDGQLGEHQVWVVLIPSSQKDSTFMKALKTTENWKTAYIDNVQHMVVNTKTPQGENLISQILQDQISFPSDYSKGLTTLRAVTENKYRDRYKELYTLAKGEFDAFPFPFTMISLMNLRGFPAFKKNVYEDITSYIDDFIQKKEVYKNESGYLQRLATADICARFLAKEKPKDSNKYTTQAYEFREEIKTINQRQVW